MKTMILAAWAVSLWLAASASAQTDSRADYPGRGQYMYPLRTWEPPRRRVPRPQRAKPPASETQRKLATSKIEHKLATIVIPSLELHAVPLAVALTKLRQESARLDPDPDPANRGLNIFLKLPAVVADTAPGAPSQADANKAGTGTITSTFDQTSILTVLQSVAAQAGLKVKVEPYAVSLVPLSESTETFVTAVYSVPPTLHDALSTPNSPHSGVPATRDGCGIAAWRDARPWLTSKGVAFPVGSSATYFFESQQLAICNTQENVDLIKALFASAPADPTPFASPTP